MTKPNLIVPKPREHYIYESALPKNTRLYFLYGLYSQDSPWMKWAIEKLTELDPEGHIACPYGYFDDISEVFHNGMTTSEFRTKWNQYYMDLAAANGCSIFWFPFATDKRANEHLHLPEVFYELGRHSVYVLNLEKTGCYPAMIIGANEFYPYRSYIEGAASAMFCCRYALLRSLEKTLEVAVEYAKLYHP